MLSVIIPVKNRANHLPFTLAPITELPDCEVIVVDDGSTDSSTDVARSYGCQVVRHERSVGPGAARNAGIRKARGDLLLFLDSDIVVTPQLPADLVRAHTVAEDLVMTGFRRHLAPGEHTPGPSSRRDSRELLADLYSYNLASHPRPWALAYSCFLSVPRSLLDRVGSSQGVFDERFRGWGLEDIELGLRLSRSGARWAFALGHVAGHQYHDRTMTRDRFQGWQANLEMMVAKHPEAAPYGRLAPAFDPKGNADFLDCFRRFAGVRKVPEHALVVHCAQQLTGEILRDLATRRGPDTSVFLVVAGPSATDAALCSLLSSPSDVLLYPKDAWQQLRDTVTAVQGTVVEEYL
ncbi:glycosyltransferase family 2 protein [Streptomyces puniciscabiei]|uniref:glycosyltransferase family 2 protein n=1 Tax=Streptomyces puniciscabiei TaxID=164348 RepID=UPI00332C35CB